MGKPGRCNDRPSPCERRTEGSDTSQYLQEKKSMEILLVAASERGTAQTRPRKRAGVVGQSTASAKESEKRMITEGFWNEPPQRVIVP